MSTSVASGGPTVVAGVVVTGGDAVDPGGALETAVLISVVAGALEVAIDGSVSLEELDFESDVHRPTANPAATRRSAANGTTNQIVRRCRCAAGPGGVEAEQSSISYSVRRVLNRTMLPGASEPLEELPDGQLGTAGI